MHRDWNFCAARDREAVEEGHRCPLAPYPPAHVENIQVALRTLKWGRLRLEFQRLQCETGRIVPDQERSGRCLYNKNVYRDLGPLPGVSAIRVCEMCSIMHRRGEVWC